MTIVPSLCKPVEVPFNHVEIDLLNAPAVGNPGVTPCLRLAKVKWLSPQDRFVITLYFPGEMVETGLVV